MVDHENVHETFRRFQLQTDLLDGLKNRATGRTACPAEADFGIVMTDRDAIVRHRWRVKLKIEQPVEAGFVEYGNPKLLPEKARQKGYGYSVADDIVSNASDFSA